MSTFKKIDKDVVHLVHYLNPYPWCWDGSGVSMQHVTMTKDDDKVTCPNCLENMRRPGL